MEFAVPLTSRQIDAAGRLYRHLNQWKMSDAALKLLAERCPGFSEEECLLKVAAINALYATKLYAQVRMAEHVSKTLRETNLNRQATELVERLASLPPAADQKKSRRFVSFASKFSHFFINADRYPILDRYAVEMVSYHLGKANCVKNETAPYLAFIENIRRLRELAGFTCSIAELDRYLWLAGVYRRWDPHDDDTINTAARDLFQDKSPNVVADLHALHRR